MKCTHLNGGINSAKYISAQCHKGFLDLKHQQQRRPHPCRTSPNRHSLLAGHARSRALQGKPCRNGSPRRKGAPCRRTWSTEGESSCCRTSTSRRPLRRSACRRTRSTLSSRARTRRRSRVSCPVIPARRTGQAAWSRTSWVAGRLGFVFCVQGVRDYTPFFFAAVCSTIFNI